MRGSAAPVGATIALLGVLAPWVAAPTAIPPQESSLNGVVVSVRGDILQIRPQHTDRLTRVVVNEQTVLLERRHLSARDLPVGARVEGWGERRPDGTVDVRMLGPSDAEATVERSVLRATGYGRAVLIVGTVATGGETLEVVDGRGEGRVRLRFGPQSAVQRWVPVSRAAFLVGRRVIALGGRASDGLLMARKVMLFAAQESAKTEEEAEGLLFGHVESIGKDGMLRVRPRFSVESVSIRLPERGGLWRQTPADPDAIAPGEALTVYGIPAPTGNGKYDFVALLLLHGAGSPFPQLRPSDRSVSGRVRSLIPLTLDIGAGQKMQRVAVPGQVPVARVREITWREIRAGESLLVRGRPDPHGGLIASAIVIGASPLAGFGR